LIPPETIDLFYPTILPNQEILFPSFAQCKALYDNFRQSSDLRKQSVAPCMNLSTRGNLGFCPVSDVTAVPRGDFDSPQIVTATGVCNKNFFQFTTQDGKLYYASKIYAAYQSLIESSPVPTPPSPISFDDLLQGGA
jgi:hypothetical protein